MTTNHIPPEILLRKARTEDAREIQSLINHYGDKGEMLPRSLNDIYENIRDFTVLVKNNTLLGCGALHVCWDDLAEIRGLAVLQTEQNKGYGRYLVEDALREASSLGVKKVFCLTYNPDFFQKLGFSKIEHKELPQKIWKDCVNCPKFPDCAEVALIRVL